MVETTTISAGKVDDNGRHATDTEEHDLPDLDRGMILGLKFVPEIRRVPVPEWGGVVYVKEMSGKERDAFEASQFESRGGDRKLNMINMRAKLVAAATTDKDGRKLFEPADVIAIGNKSARPLTRIYKIASELSGISSEDEEELTKELGETPSASSNSS